MVPKLEISSSFDIPMPVSCIVSVRFCLSVEIWISKLLSPPSSELRFSVNRTYLNFSKASLAFDISSLTKTYRKTTVLFNFSHYVLILFYINVF